MQISKHILLSCYACRPGFGTEPGVGWNWVLSLSKLGYSITVITRKDNRPFIDPEMRTLANQNINFIYVDLPINIPKITSGTGLHYSLWQINAFLKAREIHSKQKFQLVHHITYGSLQGGSWMWMLKIPLVFGPVGGGQISPKSMKQYFGEKWRGEQLRTLVTKLLPFSPIHHVLIGHAKAVLSTNLETSKIVNKFKHQRSNYFLDSGIPNWLLASDAKQLGSHSNTVRLLWVGRLMPRKAIRLALEALSYLKIPYHLTIIGDGEQKDQLADWIRELNLADHVTYRGYLPWEEVMNEYKTHDLFLFTSLRDSFGSQLLESLSQGLPIVCLDHQGAAKFVPDNASFKVKITTPIETAKDLAKAIESFSRLDLADKNEYRENALKYALTQTWDNRAAQMAKLYQEITQK